MRKTEIDRLLLNAVARAIGQPLSRRVRAKRRPAEKSAPTYAPLARASAHHHMQA